MKGDSGSKVHGKVVRLDSNFCMDRCAKSNNMPKAKPRFQAGTCEHPYLSGTHGICGIP